MNSSMAGWPVHAIPERAFRRRGKNLGGEERFLSALGGGALFLYGLGRRGAPKVALVALGAALIARGATGRSRFYRSIGRDAARRVPLRADGRPAIAMAGPGAFRVQGSITIGQSLEDVYCFVRDFEMLPRFVADVERVKPLGDARYRFRQRDPLGSVMEWDMEIVEDDPGKRILWRSTDPRRRKSAGAIYFTPAPGGRGTEITVVRDDCPPGGVLALIATFFQSGGPEMKLRGDLRRCKQLLEVGEIPTTVGQPSGRKGE
jgi:uncharacterized membrane protein